MSAGVFEGFLSTPQMLSLLGEHSVLQAMLDFEAALARAQAQEGLIPVAAASAIVGMCKAELYDLSSMVAASVSSGSLAIPLVKRLTETVALFDPDAANWVHWGTTSQDVIDTAWVLVSRRALALVDRDLSVLIQALVTLATRDGAAPMLARTLLQPAQVISFDHKVLAWAAPLVRSQERLRLAGARALKLQLGGAVGTAMTMGAYVGAVRQRLAAELRLGLPDGSWHTQRDELAALVCELGVLCGSLGKIAKDISLLAQAEVGEVAEPWEEGRGGSSSMPHKRNPVGSMVALAAALRVPARVSTLLTSMVQEHERGFGNWQAEMAEAAGVYASVHGALDALGGAVSGLKVDATRMRRNIDAQRGVVFAEALSNHLMKGLGKVRAQAVVQAMCAQAAREDRHLMLVLQDMAMADETVARVYDAQALSALFDPQAPARHASEGAAQAWRDLRQRAEQLADAAPWREWLPEQTTGA